MTALGVDQTARRLAAIGFASALITLLVPNAIAILVPLLGVAGTIWQWPALRANYRSWFTKSIWLWALVVLGAVSALWSIDPAYSFERAVRLFFEFLGGMLLVVASAGCSAAQRRALVGGLMTGLLFSLAFILLDLIFNGVVTDSFRGEYLTLQTFYSRSAIIACVLMVPVVVAYTRRDARKTAVYFVAATLSLLFSLGHLSAEISLLAIVLAALGGFAFRQFKWGMIIGGIVAIFAMPWMVRAVVPSESVCSVVGQDTSSIHRLHIWEFASTKALERPVLGWGLNAVRRVPGRDDLIKKPFCVEIGSDESIIMRVEKNIPLHTHNFMIQLWLELGVVGAAVASAIWVWLVLSASRLAGNDRYRRAAAMAPLAGLFTAASLSFGIWQGWWLAFFFLVAALLTLILRPEPPERTETP